MRSLFCLGLAALSPSAFAGIICDVGITHRTLTDAVADRVCDVVQIGPGRHWDALRIERPLTLMGAGRDETVIYCADGPCVDIAPGAGRVVLGALSVASTGTSLRAEDAELEVVSARFAPLGSEGGQLALRDTGATFTDVEIEASSLPAVDAVSRWGRDLDLDRGRFLGVSPASGARGAVYSANYGVRCTDCAFSAKREDAVAVLLWGEEDLRASLGLSDSHWWPEQYCPEASVAAEDLCSAQCGDQAVALCRMSWVTATESCAPEAVCVPDGEVPASGLELQRARSVARQRVRDAHGPWPTELTM